MLSNSQVIFEVFKRKPIKMGNDDKVVTEGDIDVTSVSDLSNTNTIKSSQEVDQLFIRLSFSQFVQFICCTKLARVPV